MFSLLSEGALNSSNNYSIDVVCIIGTNNCWRIDINGLTDGRLEWYFDGTNIYKNIIAFGGPTAFGVQPKTTPSEKTASVTNSSVHIKGSTDGLPLGDVTVNIPWLAFCSGTYLRRPGRLIPLPVVLSLRHAPDGCAYYDKTQVFEDEVGLPRRVDLFASEALLKSYLDSGIFLGKRDVDLWKRGSTGFKWNFPDGALRFHYEVTASTNFAGWQFPLAFEFFLNNSYTNGIMVPECGGIGKINSIRSSPEPQGPLGQNVVDWRFKAKGVDAIVYKSSSRSAAPTNDPDLQRTFAKWKERAAKTSVVKHADGRTKIMVALALASIIPVGLILYKSIKRRTVLQQQRPI